MVLMIINSGYLPNPFIITLCKVLLCTLIVYYNFLDPLTNLHSKSQCHGNEAVDSPLTPYEICIRFVIVSVASEYSAIPNQSFALAHSQ